MKIQTYNMDYMVTVSILIYFIPSSTATCTKSSKPTSYVTDQNKDTVGYFYVCTCYPDSFNYKSRISISNKPKVDDYDTGTHLCQDKHSLLEIEENCYSLLIEEDVRVITPNCFPSRNRIKQFFLNNKNLNIIQPGGFNTLFGLRELYLQNNKLENINEGLFNSLSELRVLNMNDNQINYIADYAFMGLNNLLRLSFSNNNISVLQSELFRPLLNLLFLDVSGNPFKNIDNVKLSFHTLKIQNIGFNSLKNIGYLYFTHDENSNLTMKLVSFNLTLLDISNNNLTQLENFIFTNTLSLTILNVSFNLIDKLESRSFSSLNHLTVLDLHHNKIKVLPNGVFNDLNSLTHLNLSQNNLKCIQFGLFDGLRLQVLNLSRNRINDFNFFSLPEPIRTELYLDNNELTDLNVKFLNKILKISLDNNRFNCEKLSEIIANLDSIHVFVFFGTTYESENIHKIACNRSNFINTHVNNMEVTELATNSNQFISKIKNYLDDSSFLKFFKSDFQNSSFYKYFKSFNSTGFANYVTHNISINVSNCQNSTEGSNFVKPFAITADVKKDDSVELMLYFIAFALYVIICILIIFLCIVVRKSNILKYNIAHSANHLEFI